MGIVFMLMSVIGMGEALQTTPLERRRLLALPLIVTLGGIGVVAISLLDAWVWHAESLTQTAELRAVVGGLLVAAGIAQAWGRTRGLSVLELPLQLAVLFSGVLAAMRERATGDERALHVVVAALVVVSTLANLAAIISGESSRAMRLFGHLLLAAAGLGLLLFEPAASAQGL